MKDLLPWYANDRLAPDEKLAVGKWLKDSPAAQAELDGLGHLRAAVTGQAQERPAEAIRQRVMTRVAADSLERSHRAVRGRSSAVSRHPSAVSWAWGMGLALAVFVLLWAAIKPGVGLQWSLNNGGVTAFQVYRAAEGSDEFALLNQNPNNYQYPTAIGLQSLTASSARNTWTSVPLAVLALVSIGSLAIFHYRVNKQPQSHSLSLANEG